MEFYFYPVRQSGRIGKKGKKKPKQANQDIYDESDITGHPGQIEFQRTNDRAAIRTAVIGQKESFLL